MAVLAIGFGAFRIRFHKMKTLPKFAVLAIFALAIPLRAQDQPLSLADCYRIASQNQPDLATAQSQLRVAEAHLKERRSPYFPHLSFGANHNQQTYNFAATPGTAPSTFTANYHGESWSTSPYYFTGLGLSQNIYDF